MKSPLVPITIPSVYTNKAGEHKPLPPRLAKCTPDTRAAILALEESVLKAGGRLILSDMFRSYDAQNKSHMDYALGGKRAYSPAPGGSFHEAGRAFDLDLSALVMPLAEFWKLAAKVGITPIISEPKTYISEAWHFECRGSHQLVYDYYLRREGYLNAKPYTGAAQSAILSVGITVDLFDRTYAEASIQSCLIRLGKNCGYIDGLIGPSTRRALKELGMKYEPCRSQELLIELEGMLKEKFPREYC
jgi:hypothetical protein